jgi:hypothetical protein
MKEEVMTSKRTYLIVVGAIAATVLALSALGMGHARVARPAASEFGPKSRVSAQGLYVVSLQGADSLKARKMYTLQAIVLDRAGAPVTEAAITIGGGMPEHRHGLPTKPRVTANLGNGSYEISGVRFNMGGWWELKLTVEGPAGTDTVTFNLAV